MKKIEVTKEQMVEAVKVNAEKPWEVLGLGRTNWFKNLSKNGVTMAELRSSSSSSNVPAHTIRPVPQWEPNVPNEANSVGRGGVRYRYTDMEKYNEFKKEDAFCFKMKKLKELGFIDTLIGENKTTTKERQLVSINIKEENGKQTVSARELHEKLEVTERFSSWFDRMLKYGFEENVDFTSVKSFTVVNNGAQKPIDEYYISIDMAKEICMIQRSDKGRMFRQYFIECERRMKQTVLPSDYKTALLQLVAKIEENEALAAKGEQLLLEKQEAEAETERIYQVNKNFHNNLYTASQIAKKLGITANMVGRIANEHGLKQDPIYGKLGKIQLNNGQWVNQFYYNDDALTVIEAVIG